MYLQKSLKSLQFVGANVGCLLGIFDGSVEGLIVGLSVGLLLGVKVEFVGCSVGF
jgi:hypothetical protein